MQTRGELRGLDEADRVELLESYGQSASGLVQVVQSAYDLLGLQSYLTAGEQETRLGQSKKAGRHHRPQELFTLTSKKASLQHKLYHMKTLFLRVLSSRKGSWQGSYRRQDLCHARGRCGGVSVQCLDLYKLHNSQKPTISTEIHSHTQA